MNDARETLARYGVPISNSRLKQMAFALPLLRIVRSNPVLMVGAAVVGVAGMLAWRNREKVAQGARPLIRDARVKGQSLMNDARALGEDLISQARSVTSSASRATSRRNGRSETGANDAY